ncbi:MAG: hypothetical protein HY286_18970 [Planctomycetes bacterium]|nr:hypothetical protein [Planctomycetota bacterium]
MFDLVFVARKAPPATDLFWQALSKSGLANIKLPATVGALAPFGIQLVTFEVPRAPRDEIDRDAAAARAREMQATAADRLEKELRALGPRIVVFIGAALYASVVGIRADDASDAMQQNSQLDDSQLRVDRSSLTFQIRAPFAGAIAVAVPADSRMTNPEQLYNRYAGLAALRAELALNN